VSESFISRHGAKILALIPLAFLIWVVAQYAVDAPYLDQWELVPLLEKSYHGELTLPDLWVQHNEHRIFFPQIIMLVLARLTGWNSGYELAVNILLALGLFAVFIRQVKIAEQKLGVAGLSWAVPAISLVVFSLSQFQNWLWGWQLGMFLNLLTVMGGIVLLAGETFRWHRFVAAALLGIVATYSFASGALVWPIGLVILFVTTTGIKERKPGIIGWILIGGLTLWSYFYHYHKPEEHPPLSLIFQMPLEYTAYVFKYIGSIGVQGVGGDRVVDGVLAFIFGLFGTVALGWTGWMLVRKQIAGFRTLLPYFAMSLYSVGSAMITGVGRLGFGSDQALASRYCTMETPLWVSLIVFLILLAKGEAKAADASSPVQRPGRRPILRPYQLVAQWSLKAAIVFLILGSVFALVGAINLSRQQAYGRARLLDLVANPQAGIDYDGLSLIYPRPEVIVERYPILLKHRLSMFRNQASAPDSP
jgi:hypothetical protein